MFHVRPRCQPSQPSQHKCPGAHLSGTCQSISCLGSLKGEGGGRGHRTAQHSQPSQRQPGRFPAPRRFSIGIPDVSGRNSGCYEIWVSEWVRLRPRCGHGAAKLRPSCGQVAAKLRPRCGHGAATVRPRCGQGAAKVRPRCGQGAAKVRPRCGQGAAKLRPSCGQVAAKLRPSCVIHRAWALMSDHV